MNAEGWYRDPYLRHDARWYSAGKPTALVMDDGSVSRDPIPDGPISAVDIMPAPLPDADPTPYDAGPADDPGIRSGVDDPFGLRPAVRMVQYGTSLWRFPLLGFGCAITILAVAGISAAIFVLPLILIGLVPLLSLPATIRNLVFARSVRNRPPQSGDALSFETERAPLIARKDIAAGVLVAAEICVLTAQAVAVVGNLR